MGAGIALLLLLAIGGFATAAAVLSPDDCSQDVDIPDLSFSASPLSCAVVWTQFNFILRHHYNESIQRLSIVLSASFASNWFGMGFSPTGAMVESSAMVGYMSVTGGDGVINQYYLAGKTSDEVFVGQGNLTIVPNSGVVTLQNQTMYMAYQVEMNDMLAASSKVIYAYGYTGITPNSSGYIEGPHRAASEMSFNFVTGSVAGSPTAPSSPVETLRKGHGILNIFAWSLLAPLGAFAARYLRHRDSLWFPLHVGCQIASYILGIGAAAVGIKLTKELPAGHWKIHRIVGISVLFLASLQILAICARPNKDSRRRKMWNWYHSIVGRCVLLLAAVNHVIGIRVAAAPVSWRAGYAVLLTVTLIAFLVLEPIYWLRWRKRRQAPAAFSSYEMM